MIDEHLTWKYHINSVNSKISKAIFSIKQTKNFLPTSSLLTLYNSLIHPHISYGLQVWGSASLKYISKTTKLQKRAIRMVCKASFNSHTEPIFKALNVLSLMDIHRHQISLFMFDYINGNLPNAFDGMFLLNSDINRLVQTRQSNLLYVHRNKNAFVLNLPYIKYAQVWNQECQNCDTNIRSTFKKRLKSIYISKYSSEVICDNVYCKDCRSCDENTSSL